MTLSIFWCIFSAKFLICQSFDILGIFFLWLHTGCLILVVNSHVFGGILLLPLLRLLNVVFSGQLLAAEEVNFCICTMIMYQQNYWTHCTFLERSLLSRIFVNIASCTNVFYLSCYMLPFYCCDETWWRRQLIKGISYFDLWSQKVRAHHWWGSLTVSSRPGVRSWELRVHIFKHKNEAERGEN